MAVCKVEESQNRCSKQRRRRRRIILRRHQSWRTRKLITLKGRADQEVVRQGSSRDLRPMWLGKHATSDPVSDVPLCCAILGCGYFFVIRNCVIRRRRGRTRAAAQQKSARFHALPSPINLHFSVDPQSSCDTPMRRTKTLITSKQERETNMANNCCLSLLSTYTTGLLKTICRPATFSPIEMNYIA